ncbi:hypothetical protein HA402_007503 [Bradysia odoriphaga]|nr:hypothetical protein HA402_007503 [Bradysia odoriphaga]
MVGLTDDDVIFNPTKIVAAVSWPIVDPDRKAFVNIGFQFNYNMPFAPSSFYDPMYWRNLGRSTKTELSVDTKATKNGTETHGTDEVKNVTKRYVADIDTYDRTKYQGELHNQLDISAGELYKSVETMLVEAGYDKTCLLKSICDVARHPFHIDDGHEDLLAEILQFILTPSMHQGFGRNEHYLKERYDAAEDIGRIGGDCGVVYSDCTTSFIDNLSYLRENFQ